MNAGRLLSGIALAALLWAAPLSGQGSAGDVHFRTGVAAGGLCGVALVPGVEASSRGALHVLASIDAYLQVARSSSCDRDPSANGSTEVTRTSLSPPRMRVGAGWRTGDGQGAWSARAFVGQQGVVEGLQPLAGVGALLESGTWGIGLDASLHRGTVYRRFRHSEIPDLIDEEPLRTAWAPRVELFGQLDSGAALTGTLRPALGGILVGAGGALVGGLTAVTLSDCGSGCAAEFFMGAALGETIALPLGVHLGDRRRGRYSRRLLASVGVAAAGTAAALLLSDHGSTGQGIAVLVPIGQLAAAIAVERRADPDG